MERLADGLEVRLGPDRRPADPCQLKKRVRRYRTIQMKPYCRGHKR